MMAALTVAKKAGRMAASWVGRMAGMTVAKTAVKMAARTVVL